MDIKSIKNTREFFWTNHSKYKLLQYGLSPTLIKKVIRRPERTEEGIAPETTALMLRKDTKKTKKEVWVMIQKQGAGSSGQELREKDKSKTHPVKYFSDTKNNFAKQNLLNRVKIISAWIYPGVSPQGKDIYVPEDVWEELENKA